MNETDGFWAQQRDEHVNENIKAKRVVNYVWNSDTGQWERSAGNSDLTANYAISDTDESGTVHYYGYLDKDGAWYIMQQTPSASVTTYRYVKGASGYDFSTRAAQTYVTFDAAF